MSIDIKTHNIITLTDFQLKYPAVVLFLQGNDLTNVDNTWEALNQNSDIRLLVSCDSDINSEIQDWCLKNEFELIELHESYVDDTIDGKHFK